jgi:tripartite-type tricarboxylate transporter receptor subunit TctC
MKFRLIARIGAVMVAAVFAAGMNTAYPQADARAYPAKTVHVLVGNVAGSGNDLIARLFCQRLNESLGQPFVVENRPSSGSLIAGEFVARAPADGYTLLFATAGLMVNAPVMYSKLAFSTERDFAAISMAAKFPVVLISNAALPINSVRELIAWTKANRRKANYGAAGAGLQLAGALFKARTDAPIEHIPYKGGSQVVNAVAAGDLTMALVDAGSATGLLSGGKIRALAVASTKRSPLLPDVPTMSEAGVRDAEVELWNGLFAPAGTPQGVIRKLQDEMVRVARLPDTRERLIALAAEPVGSTADELTRTVSAELAKWATVAKSANIKPE